MQNAKKISTHSLILLLVNVVREQNLARKPRQIHGKSESGGNSNGQMGFPAFDWWLNFPFRKVMVEFIKTANETLGNLGLPSDQSSHPFVLIRTRIHRTNECRSNLPLVLSVRASGRAVYSRPPRFPTFYDLPRTTRLFSRNVCRLSTTLTTGRSNLE